MYRMLIVEDDKFNREGLVNFLDWNSLGIEVAGCACNGLEGKTMAEEIRPHIIVTDIIMPKLDGIQMSKEIRTFLPDSVIILLSGYDDFQYAKQSFEFHAFAYLLKPVQKDPLEDTLLRALKVLDEQESQKIEAAVLQNQWVNFVRANQANNLLDFLECKTGSMYFNEALAEKEFDQNGKKVVAILTLFSDGDANETSEKATRIDQTEFLYEIECLLSLERLALIHSKPLKEVVLCMDAPETVYELDTKLQEMMSKLRSCLGVEAIIGIGETVDGFVNMPQSYMQAREVIKYSCLADYGDLLHYRDFIRANRMLWESATPLLLQADDVIENMKFCVQKGKNDECNILADNFLAILKEKRYTARVVLSSFILSILKWLDLKLPLNNSEHELNINDELKTEVFELDSFYHTRQYVLGILSSYAAVVKENSCHEEIARKVIEIIEASFAEDLDLKRLSRQVYLSRYYVGSIFKKYTGMSFNQYLNEYRIRKAKEVLRNKDIKLNDLARSVGIHNPSYFSELFKKKYGLTPGAFKELMRGIL